MNILSKLTEINTYAQLRFVMFIVPWQTFIYLVINNSSLILTLQLLWESLTVALMCLYSIIVLYLLSYMYL